MPGALLSPPDPRDYMVSSLLKIRAELPDEWELPWIPPVQNQGSTGNCVAQAMAGIKEVAYYGDTGVHKDFSVGFPYGYPEDGGAGMVVRHALDNMIKNGNVFAADFESNAERPLICQQVAARLPFLLPMAAKNRAVAYYMASNSSEAINFIYTYRLPVLIVAESKHFTQYSDGYHAVIAYGWRKGGKVLKYLNSWGNWGMNKDGKGEIEFDKLNEVWAMTEKEYEKPSPFSDIAKHWAKNDIEESAKLGFTAGYEDHTFRPESSITRAESLVGDMRTYRALVAEILELQLKLIELESRLMELER